MLLLAAIPFLVGSCISDNEIVSDDYCYIMDVSLGQMKRESHMQDSLGKDTTIITSYTAGNNYPITIDQRTLTIENKDSLLYGTLLQAVLVDISFNGSALYYREKDGADSTWFSYGASDSLDLRKPLELLLMANDGMSSRVYTLKLNVHKQEGDSLYWKKVGDADPQLQNMSQQRGLIVEGKLAVLGGNNEAVTLMERTAEGTWQSLLTNLPVETDVQTLAKQGDSFFVSTTDGYIYTSVDGKDWQKLNIPQHPGIVLAGATPDFIYTLMDGELYGCRQSEQGEWVFLPESLDESSTYLPASGVRTLVMKQDNGNHRLILLGNRTNDTDKTSVVWNKMWNDEIAESGAVWMYLNQTSDNMSTLPQLDNLNLIQYDGKCLAFGGASVVGKGTNKAMDALYVSQDYGITWRKDSEWHLPKELKGTNGSIVSAVGDDNVIWIIANGEVWRGKLNRLDFER